MLNTKPGSTREAREDLPVFQMSVAVDGPGGVYYFTQGGIDSDIAQAAVYDNSGERWISGLKIFASASVPASKALSIVPCISTDDGANWTPITDLSVPLSGQRRGSAFLQRTALFKLPDGAALIYRVTLTKPHKVRLSATLYLY